MTDIKKKILIAEDAEFNLMTIEQMLSALGHEYSSVTDGKQAYESAKMKFFDFVLMDIQMPVMDGKKATFKIREELTPPRSSVPVIALTAENNQDKLAELFIYGFDAFLQKPVSPESINDKMIQIEQQLKESLKNDLFDQGFKLDKLKTYAGGDKHFAQQVSTIFFDELVRNNKQMQQALEQENWQKLNIECHRFFTRLSFIKAESLRNTTAIVNQLSRQQKKDNIHETLNQIFKETKALEQAVNNHDF